MSKFVLHVLLKYILLTVLRRRRGGFLSDSRRRSLKRLLAYHLYKKEVKRYEKLKLDARRKRTRKYHVRPWLRTRKDHGAWYTLVPIIRETDPEAYFNFFRMTPECFDWLLDKTHDLLLKTSIRESISPGERLAVTLRYLASGDSEKSLSYLFRIADQSISKILLETTYVIWTVLRDILFEPLSEDFWMKKAAEFEVMTQFPMCVGAADGKHVFVQKFAKRGSEYYSYKDQHSVILFAVADAKYKFIVVDVGAKGRESDGGVFERSTFGKLYVNNQLNLPPALHREDLKTSLPFVFLGDDAYTFDEHMMKPFERPSHDAELIFNYRLSRARRVVENAFGILSARFRLFRRPIIGSETLVCNCILAATALHNLHLMREDSVNPKHRAYLPPGFADVYKSNGKFLKKGRWRNEVKHEENQLFHQLRCHEQSTANFNSAHAIREKFVSHFISNPIPWQWHELPAE